MSTQKSQSNTSAIDAGSLADTDAEQSSSVQRRRKSMQDISTRHTSLNIPPRPPLEDDPYPNNLNDADNSNSRRASFVSGIIDSVTNHRRNSIGFMRLEEGYPSQRDDPLRLSLQESQLLDIPLELLQVQNAPDILNIDIHNNDPPISPQQLHYRTPTITSRPPSYRAYSSEQQNAQRQQEWVAAIRLQQYYNREHRLQNGSHWLQEAIRNSENGRVQWKDALTACFADQFRGFYMAFWIVILVFVGAISVFLPTLATAAFAMWIPLILYVLLALFMLYHRKRRLRRIHQLEYEVAKARERRIRELMSAMILPENHYFVTEYGRNSHAHPVTTLLPPPPAYRHDVESSSTTMVRENTVARDQEDERNRDA